jgi:hypothetical protein
MRMRPPDFSMHNAADHPAVVDPRLAASVGRQKRLQPRELVVGQPSNTRLRQDRYFSSTRSPEKTGRLDGRIFAHLCA